MKLSPRNEALGVHVTFGGNSTDPTDVLALDLVQQRLDEDLVRFRRSERRFVVFIVLLEAALLPVPLDGDGLLLHVDVGAQVGSSLAAERLGYRERFGLRALSGLCCRSRDGGCTTSRRRSHSEEL